MNTTIDASLDRLIHLAGHNKWANVEHVLAEGVSTQLRDWALENGPHRRSDEIAILAARVLLNDLRPLSREQEEQVEQWMSAEHNYHVQYLLAIALRKHGRYTPAVEEMYAAALCDAEYSELAHFTIQNFKAA